MNAKSLFQHLRDAQWVAAAVESDSFHPWPLRYRILRNLAEKYPNDCGLVVSGWPALGVAALQPMEIVKAYIGMPHDRMLVNDHVEWCNGDFRYDPALMDSSLILIDTVQPSEIIADIHEFLLDIGYRGLLMHTTDHALPRSICTHGLHCVPYYKETI